MQTKLQKHIESTITQYLEEYYEIGQVSSVAGGSINDAYKIRGANGSDFFVKVNSKSRYPQMFEKEKRGLELLAAANAIAIPQVIAVDSLDDSAYLILEYIPQGTETPRFWNDLGTQLANLHRHTDESFGLDEDNYIGSLHQSNRRHDRWGEFFAQERLAPLARQAFDSGLLNQKDLDAFEKLYSRLDEIFPEEPPALLHGDLWSGNYYCGVGDIPFLIDPAVYYGHREMDIAMTRMFGGFALGFYQAYHEQNPLAPGWESRISLANIYPSLVHVVLFGSSYLSSVREPIRQFY